MKFLKSKKNLLCLTELHKKETVECVTIIETPPMVVVGLVGSEVCLDAERVLVQVGLGGVQRVE